MIGYPVIKISESAMKSVNRDLTTLHRTAPHHLAVTLHILINVLTTEGAQHHITTVPNDAQNEGKLSQLTKMKRVLPSPLHHQSSYPSWHSHKWRILPHHRYSVMQIKEQDRESWLVERQEVWGESMSEWVSEWVSERRLETLAWGVVPLHPKTQGPY